MTDRAKRLGFIGLVAVFIAFPALAAWVRTSDAWFWVSVETKLIGDWPAPAE